MAGVAWITSGPAAHEDIPRLAIRQGPGVVRVLIRDEEGPTWPIFGLIWLPAFVALTALVFAHHLHRLQRIVFLAPLLVGAASLALTTRWPAVHMMGLALGILTLVRLVVAKPKVPSVASGVGTVATTKDSKVVSGTNTLFILQVHDGDIIDIVGETARRVEKYRLEYKAHPRHRCGHDRCRTQLRSSALA